MSVRLTLILTLAMLAVAVVLSLAVFPQLPERVASHWNANDQVDGSMPRFWGAFIMPIITLAMVGLFLLIPVIDPMRANIASFRGTFNAFIVVIVAFLLYLHILTVLWNLGWQSLRMSAAVLPGLGALFVFAGFLLRKARRNYSIGIRTPWTLASDRVWDRTHRLGAILFVASGVLTLLGILFPGPIAYIFVLVPVLLSTLVLVVYSYILWRAEQTGA